MTGKLKEAIRGIRTQSVASPKQTAFSFGDGDVSTKPGVDTRPFVPGSDTSKAAAESVRESTSRYEALVYDIIRRAEDGMTDDELEIVTHLPHQTVSARRNGLVKKGKVCDSGKRRLTRSGRQAIVWMLGVGEPVLGTPNNRVSRPADCEIREANRLIGEMVLVTRDAGIHIGENQAITRLRAWLCSITS